MKRLTPWAVHMLRDQHSFANLADERRQQAGLRGNFKLRGTHQLGKRDRPQTQLVGANPLPCRCSAPQRSKDTDIKETHWSA